MMYEPPFSPDAGLHSVIVQNAAVLLNQDSHSSCITTDVYNRMTYAGTDSSKQKLQANRRKSDSDAPQILSFSQTSPSSCQSSPSPSPFSQPVSPDSYGSINSVAGVTIHEGFSKPTERGGVVSGSAQVCRVQPLTSMMPSGSDGLITEVPSTTACEAGDTQSLDSPPSPGSGRPRGVLVPSTSMPCMICGDRSTGKHYGAFSCDGCKGFFRRSIRKKTGYRCRFNHECKMTKDMRNQCRDCRLRKCISAGMKKEAVQNERDRITHRRAGGDVPSSPPEVVLLTTEILVNAERLCKQQAPSSGEARQDSERCLASVMDVAESVKQQLLVLVEWAKAVPAFAAMHLEDKIKLLKAHSGEHLLLGIAWRSLNSDKYLLLGNDKLIPRLASGIKVPHGRFATDEDMPLSNINWIASRVLDDVVQPLRELKVDSHEFIILRCMIFFDPLLHGLTDPDYVHRVRLQGQLLLEDYIMDRHDVECRGRFGQIMFMLPYLQTIATAMIQQIQLAKMDGFTGVDTLITEMLLSSADETLDKQVFPTDVVHPMLAPPPPHRSLRQHDAALKSPGRSLPQHQHTPTSPERYILHQNHQKQSHENASISPDRQSLLQHVHSTTSPDRSMLKQEQGSTSPGCTNLLLENASTSPEGTVLRYEHTHSSPRHFTLQHSHTPPDRECVSTSNMDDQSVFHHRLPLPTVQRSLCDQRSDSTQTLREQQFETSDERDALISNRDGKRVIHHPGMDYTGDINRSSGRDYSHDQEMEYTEDTGPVEHSTRQYDSRNFALYRDIAGQPKVAECYGPMIQEPCDLSPYSSCSCTSSGERSPAVSGHSSYACSNTGDRSPGEEQLQPLNLQQVPD